MEATVVVLGTSHRLQGVDKNTDQKIDDPNYGNLVSGLIRGKDFVFEEASGLGPTTAERLASKILGEQHYLDVDPSVDDRPALGIEEITQFQDPVRFDSDEGGGITSVHAFDVVSHDKRELHWLSQIAKTQFRSKFKHALLICGHSHALSMCFRLRSAGYICDVCNDYAPHELLCRREHKE